MNAVHPFAPVPTHPVPTQPVPTQPAPAQPASAQPARAQPAPAPATERDTQHDPVPSDQYGQNSPSKRPQNADVWKEVKRIKHTLFDVVDATHICIVKLSAESANGDGPKHCNALLKLHKTKPKGGGGVAGYPHMRSTTAVMFTPMTALLARQPCSRQRRKGVTPWESKWPMACPRRTGTNS